jgi:endo-1,4-beta-xylanase
MNFQEEISRQRTTTITLRMPQFLAGMEVNYKLKRLDFEFGTTMFRSRFFLPETDSDRQNYLSVIERYFNAVMIPIFWHLLEPEQGQRNDAPYLAMCQWANEQGKSMLGHALFYGWDGKDDCDPADTHLDFIQPWLRKLSPDALIQAMQGELRLALPIYGRYTREFILQNEILGKYGTDPHDWFSKRLGFHSLFNYFAWANEVCPKARYYLNENSILAGENTPVYLAFIESLQTEGVRIGGIGIQGHFFGDRIPPSEEMWEKLNALARFNLPIRITEFGVKATDPEQHAADLERFLTICFAHPAVIGVNFWNFWEPDMWPLAEERREAHLWNRDWSPQPAGEVFMRLVEQTWNTQGRGVLDTNREVTFHGYRGIYQVTVQNQVFEVNCTGEGTSFLL